MGKKGHAKEEGTKSQGEVIVVDISDMFEWFGVLPIGKAVGRFSNDRKLLLVTLYSEQGHKPADSLALKIDSISNCLEKIRRAQKLAK